MQTGPRYSTVSGGEASELQYSRLDLVVIQHHNEIFKSVEGGLFNSLWSLRKDVFVVYILVLSLTS